MFFYFLEEGGKCEGLITYYPKKVKGLITYNVIKVTPKKGFIKPFLKNLSTLSIAHLGNPPRERRGHFAVYFSAGFSGKTVQCTLNELCQMGQRVRLRTVTALW